MSRMHDRTDAARIYKALKEDFVSNLAGGSITEINCVTAVAPVAVLLWSVLQSRHGFFRISHSVTHAIELLLNVLVVLLATTLYASRPLLLLALLLAPIPVLHLLVPRAKLRHEAQGRTKSKDGAQDVKGTRKKEDALSPLPKRSFLTNYRGTMLVITSLSILSVDFRVFPRRFAKVENWGTSLMDMGVGSFVFSAGVVGARPLLLQHATAADAGLDRRLMKAVRHSLPLLVLGVIRLWSVKGLKYAEHVSEYGVHWNFFFTLGLLPPFVALFQSVFSYIHSYSFLAIFLAATYQVILDCTPLTAYILTAPRTDLLRMNREGICSFVGYLAIFLAGQGTGLIVLPRHLSQSSYPGWQHRKKLLLNLAAWSLIWSLLFLGCTNWAHGLNLKVSRRLANLPYVLWVAAFNTCHLTAFCVIETLLFPEVWENTVSMTRTEEEARYKGATSGLLEAFNQNGLALFLLANLMTGVVNLTISTIEIGPWLAMAILVGYGTILSGIAITLNKWHVRIKI